MVKNTSSYLSDFCLVRLQKLLVQNLEEIAKEKECNIFCATVAPKNKFSLNTLLKLEYKIVLEKEKYGGLKRYIMIKET